MGKINDITALERSSNVYMAKLYMAMGGETYRPNAPKDWNYKSNLLKKCVNIMHN